MFLPSVPMPGSHSSPVNDMSAFHFHREHIGRHLSAHVFKLLTVDVKRLGYSHIWTSNELENLGIIVYLDC